MLAYIFNTHGRLPHEIYNLPLGEKLLIYEACRLQQEADKKSAEGAGAP